MPTEMTQLVVAMKNSASRRAPSGTMLQPSVARAASANSAPIPAPAIARRWRGSVESRALSSARVPPYDPAEHERFVDRTIAQCSRAWFGRVAPVADASPVFICGMFRSGTTLIAAGGYLVL